MKKILIADDNEFILFGLSKAIKMVAQDFEVITAGHGKQAVDKLTSHSVDLVVTDFKMPVMNGVEVAEYVNKHFPHVPIYVMTGDYLPEVKEKFKNVVVSRFISKPFSFRQLAEDILLKLAPADQTAAV